MITKKKIVLVGPSGVGKTTIQKAFFEQKNPNSLLEFPLKPSRGVNSSIYTAFDTDLGIFDLAGQENETWFSKKGKDVFNESNIIICVFDIRNSLESIINFLIKIYKLKKELNLRSCNIIAFLHKIDLRSNPYVYHKLKNIQDFITIQHPQGKDFEIYETSITRDYFYKTYCIISSILNLIYQRNLIPIKQQEFQELKRELSIILTSDPSIKYKASDLINNSETNFEDIKHHLERLEKLGFIKSFDEFESFKLTDRAYYFKFGLEEEISSKEESRLNKSIELFHIFLYLEKKKYELLNE